MFIKSKCRGSAGCSSSGPLEGKVQEVQRHLADCPAAMAEIEDLTGGEFVEVSQNQVDALKKEKDRLGGIICSLLDLESLDESLLCILEKPEA